MQDHKLQIAIFLLRVFTGILFLFQGYDKLFRIKMEGVIDTFQFDAAKHHIPKPMVVMMAYYTSIVEFAGGIMLILGLFTNYALYALGLDLLMVCFAFSLVEPMWDMKHVFPRFILVIFLLVLPPEHNKLSVDHLLDLKKYIL
jgi:putative oxidoreductase